MALATAALVGLGLVLSVQAVQQEPASAFDEAITEVRSLGASFSGAAQPSDLDAPMLRLEELAGRLAQLTMSDEERSAIALLVEARRNGARAWKAYLEGESLRARLAPFPSSASCAEGDVLEALSSVYARALDGRREARTALSLLMMQHGPLAGHFQPADVAELPQPPPEFGPELQSWQSSLSKLCPVKGVLGGAYARPISAADAARAFREELLADEAAALAFLWPEPLLPGHPVRSPTGAGGSLEEVARADRESWFIWVDERPGAKFSHSTGYIFLERDTGEYRFVSHPWWPLVDGAFVWGLVDDPVTSPNLIYDGRRFIPPLPDVVSAARVPASLSSEDPASIVVALYDVNDSPSAVATFLSDANDFLATMAPSAAELHLLAAGTGGSQARDVEAFLSALAARMQCNQMLYIFYAGHTSVDTRFGQITTFGGFGKPELRRIFQRFRAKGCKVVLVLDTCHAEAVGNGVIDLVSEVGAATGPDSSAYDSLYWKNVKAKMAAGKSLAQAIWAKQGEDLSIAWRRSVYQWARLFGVDRIDVLQFPAHLTNPFDPPFGEPAQTPTPTVVVISRPTFEAVDRTPTRRPVPPTPTPSPTPSLPPTAGAVSTASLTPTSTPLQAIPASTAAASPVVTSTSLIETVPTAAPASPTPVSTGARCAPSGVARGATVLCTAAGFQGNESVNVIWTFSAGSWQEIRQADAQGLVTATWTVPPSGYPAGQYAVAFQGVSSGRQATATFAVL